MSADPIFQESPKLPERIGAFEILDVVGEGGMGTVYLAEQTHPIQRTVAVKVLRVGMESQAALARFEAEREAVAMMDHPNIARVYDAGTTDDGRPYMAMELVPGQPVNLYCDGKELTLRERLALFVSICRAVHHAHQKAIIHRDLKPSNVLVQVVDGRPVPKVIDFGVAKDIDRISADTLCTEQGLMIGTPVYMSPEQAEMRNQDIDTTTDVYSLGVTLYELLTGLLPFEQEDLLANGLPHFLRLIREVEPPRPSERMIRFGESCPVVTSDRGSSSAALARQLRGELDWIVMRAMAKDRSHRYQSALDLSSDVERYLEDQPVLARPPSRAYRLRKLIKRNRMASMGLGSFVGALALGLTLTTAFYLQAKKARHETEAANVRLAQANYVANLQLAARSVEAHEGQLVREYLDRCDPGLRGWEWTYLARQADHSERTVALDRSLYPAFLSPDGSRCVGWELGADGGGFSVIDVESGTKLRDWNLDLEQTPMTLTFDPGLETAAGWFYRDAVVRVWRANSELALEVPNAQDVLALALSKSGDLLAVADPGGVTIWDVRREARSSRIALASPVAARGLVFAENGAVLAMATQAGVEVWRRGSGQRVFGRIMRASCEGGAECVALSPDGKRVAIGSGDQRVRVYAAAGGSRLASLEGHENTIVALRFSHDGTRIVSGARDRTARTWTVAPFSPETVLHGSLTLLEDVAFSAKDRQVVVLAGDEVVMFDADGKNVETKLELRKQVQLASFPAVGEELLVITPLSVERVNPETGASSALIASDRDRITQSALSPDRSRLLLGYENRELVLYDLPAGTRVRQLADGDGPALRALGISTKANRVYAIRESASSRTLSIWDTRTGDLVTEEPVIGVPEDGLAVSPDGIHIALCTTNGLEIRDAADGAVLSIFPTSGDSPRYNGDGSRLAVIRSGQIRVFDADNGTLVTAFAGHDNPVTTYDLNPDGSRVVSGSLDQTMRLWDTATGDLLLTFRNHQQAVSCVEFGPAGKRIVSSAYGNELILWEP